MWSTDANSNQYIAAKTITPDYYESANFGESKMLLSPIKLLKSISKLGFSRLRFYVTGKNLITFTKYDGMDPELGDQRAIPLQREFIFGLNFSL